MNDKTDTEAAREWLFSKIRAASTSDTELGKAFRAYAVTHSKADKERASKLMAEELTELVMGVFADD